MGKLLSLLFGLLRSMAPGEWLVVLLLLWWGNLQTVHGATAKGATAFAVAALIALLSLAGRALHYALFSPEGLERSNASVGAAPAVLYGEATGDCRTRSGLAEVELPTTVLAQPVQVRWMASNPPHLAVLDPRDLSPTLFSPLSQAESWSLWYPGSQVRTGWIYVRGRRQYGLELAFAGKRLLLALEDEDAAAQIRRLLETA